MTGGPLPKIFIFDRSSITAFLAFSVAIEKKKSTNFKGIYLEALH